MSTSWRKNGNPNISRDAASLGVKAVLVGGVRLAAMTAWVVGLGCASVAPDQETAVVLIVSDSSFANNDALGSPNYHGLKSLMLVGMLRSLMSDSTW